MADSPETTRRSRIPPDPRDPPELKSIRLQIPKIHEHKKLTPCLIGDQNSPLELIFWLRSLSNRYTACPAESFNPKRINLTIMATCNTPQGDKDFPMFDLSFDAHLKDFCLKMPKADIKIAPLQDEWCRAGLRTTDGGWSLHFFSTNASNPKEPGSRHPYDVLLHAVRDNLTGDDQYTQLIREILFPLMTGDSNKRAILTHARTDLGKVLSDWTGGSVQVNYTAQSNRNLTPCGDKGYLFGLTCVFPWCIDVLLKRPNCLMTDSTFKSLAPYTLPILHAIVANESLPIAFGISPTETAESYNKIYQHITGVGNGVYGRFFSSPPLPTPVSTQDNSHGEWPEDLPTNLEEEIAGEPLDPGVWFANIPTVNTSPLVPPVAPAASNPADFKQLLCSIPLLTDQGRALESFISHWHLIWKICHRHIIESMDASSLIGQWGARLLRCYSEKEWEHTRDIIILEMSLMESQFSKTDKGFTSLLMLLGQVTKQTEKHRLANKCHWALWLRLGIPRTTNSAESVNGHLNAKIKDGQDYFERLNIVAGHFLARYRSRNVWCDRALKRNAGKCFPSVQAQRMPWFSRDRQVFYLALHNAFGMAGPGKRQFPPEQLAFMIFPSFDEEIGCYDLPAPFQDTEGQIKQRDTDKRIILTANNCATPSAYLGWQIAYSLRAHLGKAQFSQYAADLYDKVLWTMCHLGIPEDCPPSAEQEAQWRSHCWLNANRWLSELSGGEKMDMHSDRTASLASPSCSIPVPTNCEKASPSPASRPVQQSEEEETTIIQGDVCRVSRSRTLYGLPNVGASCFLSAGLQCLLHVPDFQRYFTSLHPSTQLNGKPGDGQVHIVTAYLHFLGTLKRGKNTSESLETARVQLAPHMPIRRQHDVVEFLNTIFMRMHEELVPASGSTFRRPFLYQQPGGDVLSQEWQDFRSQNNTIIFDLFGWQSCLQLHCPTCGDLVDVTQPLSPEVSLGLPLLPPSSPDQGISLEDCLRNFSRPTSSERPCPGCGDGHVEQSDGILCLPHVLMLYLGRFPKSEEDINGGVKDSTYVSFPDTLDMTPYVRCPDSNTKFMYELKSVVEHLGETLHAGHYRAFLRFPQSWYCCNDDHITESDTATVHGAQAYVLFYERKP